MTLTPSMMSRMGHVTVRPTQPTFGKVVGALLWSYVGPVIFSVGVLGNVLILVTMAQRRMRGTSTCVYLRCMAVADLAVLLTGMIPEWLEARNIVTIKESHAALCKLEKFSFYTSSDTSIWICVLFTLDRFVAVCFPLRRRSAACQPWRAKYFAAGALVAAVGKNLHVLWTRGPEFRTRQTDQSINQSNGSTELVLLLVCGRPTPEYRWFEMYVRPWIAFSVVSALPFCIIVFCNVFIVRALIRMRRERSRVTAATSLFSFGTPAADNVPQMTALCLSASFCFLVCVTPSMILLIGKPYWDTPGTHWYAIAKSITNQIFYVNHSANFFLYCITGRRFRAALRSAFCCPEVESFDAARRRIADSPCLVAAAAAGVVGQLSPVMVASTSADDRRLQTPSTVKDSSSTGDNLARRAGVDLDLTSSNSLPEGEVERQRTKSV